MINTIDRILEMQNLINDVRYKSFLVCNCLFQTVRDASDHLLYNHSYSPDCRFPSSKLWFPYMFYHFHQSHYGSWWRHEMETFSALLDICAGNSPINGEFPAQRPVTRSFDVFFDRRLNKRLSKQSWGWWIETLSRPLWRHCNDIMFHYSCNG